MKLLNEQVKSEREFETTLAQGANMRKLLE